MTAERSTITEAGQGTGTRTHGRHPVHDLINQAERIAAYLRVMTQGDLTLAVVRNIPRASETAGMHARLRTAEDRQGIPWGEAHEIAQDRAKWTDVPEENDQDAENTMTAEQIVRLLAAQDAPVIDGTYANGHDYCTLCSGEGNALRGHRADCPWKLARMYVEVPV